MVTQQPLDRDAELDRLEAHALEALRQAKSLGATEVEVQAQMSQGLSAGVRLGDVETLEHMQDRGISVTVLIGRRRGQASSADLSPESIASCVEHAADIARFTQEDPCNGLADPALLATGQPDLDLWHPAAFDATAAIERALACEAAGRADSRISNSEGAAFSAGLGLSVYANSNGFCGRSSGTQFTQSCVLLAGAGDGMKRDYSYDSRRSLQDLESAEETGREAARRTVARLDARQSETDRMPVLFDPQVAAGLIEHLVGAISGPSLYRNASFLKDRAGERLFPEWLQLVERPLLPKGAASASFDAEGVATRERAIVENGVLSGYVLSSYSARRLGLETTANAGGVRNLLLQPGGEAGPDLLKAMQSGLLVTEVMGQGVNLVTGDYSRGAAGFRIENGEIAYAVDGVTIAGNLNDMFAGIRAAGGDIDTRGNVHCGSLLVDRMMVAGS
ncbi:MAG: metalloprotease PmbA [Xanthomonadales bacterium]|jgi:PmbA protein|nr:metalloprotease PmbA [Xanthomonadales bacterium]